MNVSGVSEGSECEDINKREFDNDGQGKSKFIMKPQAILTQQINVDGFNNCSNTDAVDVDECDDVSKSQLESVPVSDCEEYLSSLEWSQNDRGESLPSTKSNLIITCEQSFSPAKSSLSSEFSEPLSLDAKSFPSDCGETAFDEKNCESFSVDKKILVPNEMNVESLNGVVEREKKPLNQGLSKQESKLKLVEIINALENNDTNSLKRAALSKGGLLNDDIRRKVWPKLLGVDLVAASPRPCQQEIEQHPYYQQVVLDVNRSLKRFPPSIQEAQRLTMLDQLVILIMRVLCKHPELHYYQGYHDICVTFLLVLGEETAYHVLEKLSQTHLSVFMEKSMEPTIHLLEHMYLLIGKKRPQFNNFLLRSEVGVAYCLSWLITWFSHVLNDYSTVVRVFDFFIVSHCWMPMYVTTSLVLHREPEVMKQECDMASVHSLLCRIPDEMPFENLLTESLELFRSYKPKSLAKERPYIKVGKRKRIRRWEFVRRIKYVPATLVIAAAVLVTAVIYQAYNY